MKIQSITINPAYDKRNPDPNKDYGIHGCEILFRFGDDEKGVVQFLHFTQWHLPEVQAELTQKQMQVIGNDPYWMLRPLPADVGYHSPTPHYDGQHSNPCDCLSSGKCYYDGSGLAAERYYEILLREGSEGVWRELETYYKELFT